MSKLFSRKSIRSISAEQLKVSVEAAFPTIRKEIGRHMADTSVIPKGKVFGYGTAGFRDKGKYLDHILFRCGILAALRSKAVGGRAIGLMITASHNGAEDNGVKLSEAGGEMMLTHWEGYAVELANASTEKAVVQVINEILSKEKIDINAPALVFIGRDTRDTSQRLSLEAIQGVEAIGGATTYYSLLTTPQLHHCVRAFNRGEKSDEQGYYEKLAAAYRRIVGTRKSQPVYVDCAHGVGAPKIEKLKPFLADLLQINLINTGDGELNHNCGAEHVQKTQTFPEGVKGQSDVKYCSVDGDADRIVYFFSDGGKLKLLDGDKIIALVALFIQSKFAVLGSLAGNIRIGAVQTAYANGASTIFVRDELGVEVAWVPTGVKHLHHKAEEYDIGIYFEANGHGTVIFKDYVTESLKRINQDAHPPHIREAATTLLALPDLINQAVGDAIADMLLVEAILVSENWQPHKKWTDLYKDLPSKQTKVAVKDRSAVKTVWDETRVVEPEELQKAIDKEVKKVTNGRAFVRPSGTEDVVRVYAEAKTADEAATLAANIEKHISKLL